MSIKYTPLTELDAVNIMLELIGEQPVNSIDVGLSVVSIAQEMLHNTSRTVQARGLESNSESNYPLSPDVDGYIVLPFNCLKVDPSDGTNAVRRGNKLYDKDNHTFKFSKQVQADITFFLAFTDIPQVTRDYITIKAARAFQVRMLGSDILHSLTERDENEAYIAFVEEEIDTGDYSIFDSTSVSDALRR